MNKEIKTLGDAWEVLDSIGLKYSKGSSDCFENAEIIQNILDLNADLLAACESARQIIESQDAMFTDAIRDRAIETLEQLNEAIAKARGEK